MSEPRNSSKTPAVSETEDTNIPGHLKLKWRSQSGVIRWLPLVTILLVISLGFFWLGIQLNNSLAIASQKQQAATLHAADDQQKAAMLAHYFDHISDLLVHNDLLHAKVSDVTKSVADAQTQETLRSLDPARKASLMRFLYATRLINNDYHIISMESANLQEAALDHIDLRDTYLTGVNLQSANLQHANLTFATLIFANMTNADLRGADLSSSDMHNINLQGANLAGANLKDVTGLDKAQLARAASLSGTILPDGTKHP